MRFVVGTTFAAEADLTLVPGENLVTGEAEFRRQLGEPTTLEVDLLHIAAAIFAADLASPRGERESFVRDIELVIPVVNAAHLRSGVDDLAYLLWLLSDDNWTITLTEAGGIPEQPQDWPAPDGRTLLFSGGLDSLAAAAQFLRDGVSLHLASHYTANRVIVTSQRQLVEYLSNAYWPVSRTALRISGRNRPGYPFPEKREPSQRTRSFMFLVAGALAARRTGHHELVVMAENGQMAIHLPLTAARVGAFSTHTAHPAFLAGMATWLSNAFRVPLRITNPYVYLTKAECIEDLVAAHPAAIDMSVSCWRTGRHVQAHCGDCVPCLVRRIALEVHGHPIAAYARDLFSEDIAALAADDSGRRNLTDLLEFASWFATARTTAEVEDRYPELISQHFDPAQATEMYRRFAEQALEVARRYPGPARLLA